MYSDSVDGVSNIFVGCEFDCIYCKPSFQAQMKRQKHNCELCYQYTPHFHPIRLAQSLPLTKGDEFIWLIRSGDPSFMNPEDFQKVLNLIKSKPNRTFLIQTKDPSFLKDYTFTPNTILGTTIESNKDYDISKAPSVWHRKMGIESIDHPRKSITIEPIMDFTMELLINWMVDINPERIYIGYNSRPKQCKLTEPSLYKTCVLIRELLKKGFNVKEKLMREAWDYEEI